MLGLLVCYAGQSNAQPSALTVNAENCVSKEELINKRLGRTIAKKRKAAGYTQEEVAEQLGIGTEAFSRIERGINGASVFKLFEMADLFECGVETFLVEGSRRPSEQAERMAQMLKGLSTADRQLIVNLVGRLTTRFKSSSKKQVEEDDSRILI